MYLQTTSYDFHAPLDAYGRVTLKGAYLGHLHRALLAQQDYLMYGERTVTTSDSGAQRTVWTWKGRELGLILNYPPNSASNPRAAPDQRPDHRPRWENGVRLRSPQAADPVLMDREVLGTGGRRVELARMARAHARAPRP